MKYGLLSILVVSLLTVVNSASAIDVFSVDGDWSNPIPPIGTNVNYTTVAVPYGNQSEDQIRWGTQYLAQGQSALGFTGNAGVFTIVEGDAFQIGQLQHYNNPILFGTNIVAADLTIDMAFVNPTAFDSLTLTLGVNETLNQPVPMDDIIQFPAVLPTTTFISEGRAYTLDILGFGPTADQIQSEFVSPEGSVNETLLWGRITSVPVVPAPGALLLGGLGTGLVGLLRRRSAV